MNNNIPDYSGMKANMQGLNQFFQDGNIQVSAKDSKIIASIFNECDTEGKTDQNGKQVGDGQLKGQERTKFLNTLKNMLPEKVYNEVENFLTTVGVVEDLSFAENKAKHEKTKNDIANFLYGRRVRRVYKLGVCRKRSVR